MHDTLNTVGFTQGVEPAPETPLLGNFDSLRDYAEALPEWILDFVVSAEEVIEDRTKYDHMPGCVADLVPIEEVTLSIIQNGISRRNDRLFTEYDKQLAKAFVPLHKWITHMINSAEGLQKDRSNQILADRIGFLMDEKEAVVLEFVSLLPPLGKQDNNVDESTQ